MLLFTETLKIISRIWLSVFLAIVWMQLQAQASSQTHIPSHQINFGTGNKYLSTTDVSLASPGGNISFTRTYNSQSTITSEIGYGWTGPFTERLVVTSTAISQVQAGGRYIVFNNDGSGNWITWSGTKQVITANADGYQLKEPNGTARQYDNTGHLVTITDRNGNIQTYTYAGGHVSSISDSFGRSLSFTYAIGKLTGVTSAFGSWTYSYLTDNLIKVTKPDGKNIQYIYDDPNDAHNLTGIIDESGVRILTVAYDDQDRITSSAKSGDSDHVTIDYPSSLTRKITDSLGITNTYQLIVAKGRAKVSSMSGPGCSSCEGSSDTKYVYDDRLQITEKTNANGIVTMYNYDTNSNLINTTKAAGTLLENTTTKTYDPVTKKVATITEPSVINLPPVNHEMVTSMTYDDKGNLISRQKSGFSGDTAISTTITYTYNTYGQITKIDGPRTDVTDTVTLAYYANSAAEGYNRGNLYTTKDAFGHTTTYGNYNAFGQAAVDSHNQIQ